MPTQEENLALISNASLLQTEAVVALKVSLTQLVTDATNQFMATIERVNELSSVDNVADTNKIISTLMQAALNTKQATLVSGENISPINGQSLLTGMPLVIERSATSLNKIAYENRSNLRTETPEFDDSTMVEGLGLFMWVNSKGEPDDDETCFTTTTGQWLLMIPAYEWGEAHSLIKNSVIREYIDDNNN